MTVDQPRSNQRSAQVVSLAELKLGRDVVGGADPSDLVGQHDNSRAREQSIWTPLDHGRDIAIVQNSCRHFRQPLLAGENIMPRHICQAVAFADNSTR